MKKILLIAILGVLAIGIKAQDSGLGAGIIIGEPTGLSAKVWFSDIDALDAGLAWSISHNWIHLHADYLRHSFDLIPVEEGQLPLYYGVGARIGLGTSIFVGARLPVGLDYFFEGLPLDIFIEIVPGLALLPDTRFDIGGGIGIRYWFPSSP